MLALHTRDGEIREDPADLGTAVLPPDIAWVDLMQPTASETAFVERATGLRVPSFEDLSEIETSSRVRSEDGTLYLSVPLVHRSTAADPQTTPVGYVLSPERLVTVRFEPLTAFSTFRPVARGTAPEIFAGL